MTKEGYKTTNITRNTIFVILSLLVIMIGTFEFACYVQKDSFAPDISAFGIALAVIVLAGVILIYNRYSVFSNRFFVFLIPILFLISCMLLFVSGSVFGTTLYMMSGILFAKYINKYFGLFILFELCFLFQSVIGYSAATTIFHFLLGTLVCVLFSSIKNILTGLYFMVIETAVGILLYFVLQLFPNINTASIELFPILLSFIILITICGIFSFVYEKTTEHVSVDVQALLCACEETTENTITKDSTNLRNPELKTPEEKKKKTVDSKIEKNVEESVVKAEESVKEKIVEEGIVETEEPVNKKIMEEAEKSKEAKKSSLEEKETEESVKAV